MRLAVLADIHGNLAALDAVLADLAGRGVDRIVDLGDCLSGPLWPDGTADRLMRAGAVTIRGNHDRQVLDDPDERIGASDRFTRDRLTEVHRAWLRSLLPTAVVGDDVLLCHGTPDDDLTFLLEEVTGRSVHLAGQERIARRLGPVPQGLVLCGHSHVPRLVSLPGGPLVVNPGSVGLQAYTDAEPHPYRVEVGSPHARYAIVESSDTGWRASFLTVAYDWTAAAATAAAAGRDDWAYALATGYALPD